MDGGQGPEELLRHGDHLCEAASATRREASMRSGAVLSVDRALGDPVVGVEAVGVEDVEAGLEVVGRPERALVGVILPRAASVLVAAAHDVDGVASVEAAELGG